MDRYDPLKIEQKWQKIWEETEAFKADDSWLTEATTTDGNQSSGSVAGGDKSSKPLVGDKTHEAHDATTDARPSLPPKKYLAEMFPYPSGAGLHVGHVRNFTIVDVLARFYRQQEMNVLRPFGYDTFGLPAENYAIKTGISPKEATATNIANFRKQAKKLGYAIDWSREINTSDPEYYRWTQWCFLQLYKAGLAYQKESYQWWCPVDQTVLANEQVENGHCWRCGTEVEKKKMKQWFFKITDYADELLSSLDECDWPEKIKIMQKNWIGRSEGAEIDFEVAGRTEAVGREQAGVAQGDYAKTREQVGVAQDAYGKTCERVDVAQDEDGKTREQSANAEDVANGNGAMNDDGTTDKRAPLTVRVFTTRPDTLFGATFLVLAPEHPLIRQLVNDDTKAAVEEYCKNALKKSEVERQENKEKTGVYTGADAINPATGEKIPIWVADYVLMGYGTGAIMAVPAHDERDFAFAEKFELPVRRVVEKPEDSADDDRCYHGEGELVNSAQFDGTRSEDAREQIVAWLEERGLGHTKVTYRMRDWLISRQRYWGCPIPIAYDKDGNAHAIPEDQLPVLIPEVDDYKPDNSGRSALAKAKDWLKVTLKDEKTGEPIECTRETDTLDGYACSSWYLWRYVSPHDTEHAWDPEAIKYWEPLDIYCGGDHAVAHLLYVRFWCKFFADQGYLPFREPIKKLLYNGYINAPDGKKMSKSKGNVIDPLEVIDSGYGADTLRTYEMFIGPYDQDAAWNTEAIGGVYRFLNRCWSLVFERAGARSEDATHRVFEKVGVRNEDAAHRAQDEGATQHAQDEDTVQQARGSRAESQENSEAQSGSKQHRAAHSDDLCRVQRHKTIKKVTDDIYRCSFNTAVAALMEYVNDLYKQGATKADLVALGKLLKPFAPHLASEMLEELGADEVWPVYDPAQLVAENVEVVVQVNGKLRAKLEVTLAELEGLDDAAKTEKLQELALADTNVQKFTAGKEVRKVVVPRGAKLINIVVG